MSNLNHGLGGRLPMLKPGKLQTKQRELYDKIIASVVPWADAAGFKSKDEQEHLIGPFNATLYFGANCAPNNWADQFGFGQDISFGGFSYIFWFSDFPNQPNTSAIWTVGNQSSGCINYAAVPAC